MNLVRTIFLGLAFLLPATWTIAKADDAPSTETKTTKKTKKSKKNADGTKSESESKSETTKTDK
jgi:hypothetical protein